MKTIKIIRREALFIKATTLDTKTKRELKEAYTFHFYEERACENCEFLCERHCDICDNCASYKGGSELCHTVIVGNNKYLKLPAGDLGAVKAKLAKTYDVKVVDKTPDVPIKPFKFTGKFKEHQGPAVERMMKVKRGILKSPPRSGKTVMATAMSAMLGQKTLIVASQRDWLVGFLETYVGSKTQAPLTNLIPRRIGFCRKLEDFRKFDICLATVQTFWSDAGQVLLRKVRDMFGFIVIDEVHTSAAPKYASVMSKLNAQWVLGLSGTPDRKDGRMVLTNKIIGDIKHSVEVEKLKLRVVITRTKYAKVYKQVSRSQWPLMITSLENDKQRLKLIAETAIADAEKGHMILIPLNRVAAIKKLVLQINKLAGKTIAKPFYGGIKKADRDDTIQAAREYKVKVLVGNTKLLSTGINIPRASCLYDVTMSSNLPNCIQRVSRVLTPWDNKPDPIMRVFLDNLSARRSCLNNEWWKCIRPEFRPLMHERDALVLEGYLKERASRYTEFDGQL